MLLHYIINHTTQQMKKSLSLLEMVVSLLVMSVIVAISLKYGSSAYSQYKYSANQKKLENIQTALKNYFKAHGRLPRPSSYKTTNSKYGEESFAYDIIGDELFQDVFVYSNTKITYSKMKAGKGETNADKVEYTNSDWAKYRACDYIYNGILPFKELNLTEQDIVDEYGNFIEYWVGQYMTLKLGEHIRDTSSINKSNSSDTTFFGIPYKSGYNIKYFNEISHDNYPCLTEIGRVASCNPLDNGETRYAIAITQNPPTEKLTTTDRAANNFISNESKILYLIPPDGLRIKDVATDSFIDQPGTTAYVLISHGANANTTCYIKQQTFNENIYKNYYSSVPYDNRRHEAQNCSPMPEQEEYQPFIFFYTGTKTDFFDDQIAYSSLSSLLLD